MPWNYPFWQVLRFACAALVAGNAGVLKHSPNVTGCALAIEALFADAGAPAGLFTTVVLADSQLGEMTPRIIGDPRVAAVTLTGSERAGEAVGSRGRPVPQEVASSSSAARTRSWCSTTPTSSAAADAAVKSRYGNGGQSCISAKRFIVAESVAEEFVSLFVERVGALVVGDPTDPPPPSARWPATTCATRSSARSRRRWPRVRELVVRRPRDRRARLLLRADRARPRRAGHDRLRRGDVRPGRLDRAGPRRRPRGRAGQRHRLRAGRLGLGGRPSAPWPSAGGSAPARCSSTRWSPPTRGCRSAASAAPATAASCRPRAPASSPTSGRCIVE